MWNCSQQSPSTIDFLVPWGVYFLLGCHMMLACMHASWLILDRALRWLTQNYVLSQACLRLIVTPVHSSSCCSLLASIGNIQGSPLLLQLMRYSCHSPPFWTAGSTFTQDRTAHVCKYQRQRHMKAHDGEHMTGMYVRGTPGSVLSLTQRTCLTTEN